MMAPQNVFDHCAQTLRRGKLKLGDFHINLFSIKKDIFGFLGYPLLSVCQGVLEIFLRVSFHMFPYKEILNIFKSKI